jgi:hypothetical protein
MLLFCLSTQNLSPPTAGIATTKETSRPAVRSNTIAHSNYAKIPVFGYVYTQHLYMVGIERDAAKNRNPEGTNSFSFARTLLTLGLPPFNATSAFPT